jgi:hypothetical protein
MRSIFLELAAAGGAVLLVGLLFAAHQLEARR